MTLANRSNTLNPSAYAFDVRLGEVYLNLALSPKLSNLIVESAPLQADRVDTRASAEEISNEFGLLFARSDLSGGEGLDRAHKRGLSADSVTRYYDSKNIDFDDDGRASVLESSEALDANAATQVYGVHADGNVWFTAGTTLRKSANPTATTPAWANDDPHAAEGATTVSGLTKLGTTVYAALNANGIHQLLTGGAWTHWCDLTTTNLWAVKGRILAVDNTGKLYEAAAAAGSTLLLTLSAGQTITDVTDTGRFILAAASDGNIYAFTFDGTTVAFAGQSRISDGEVPTALGSASGVTMIATSEEVGGGVTIGRLYTATVADDGVLDALDVVKEWSTDASEQAPYGIHSPSRGSLYVGNTQGSDTHLWRYDLSYAALHRSQVTTAATGNVRSVFRVDDRLWWTIDGEGIFRDTGVPATSGYVISPLANFGTEDSKSWSGLRAVLDAMPAGTQAELSFTEFRVALDDADHPTWRTLGVITSANDTRELTIPSAQGRHLAIKIELTTAGGESPVFRSFTLRAYPGAGDTMLELPINTSDQVERLGRRLRVHGHGDEVFAYLLGLEGSSLELELIHEGLRFSGTVERVSQPSPMTPSRGSRWKVSKVLFRGRLVTSASTSNQGFGVGLFGEGLFGNREGISA